MISLALSLMTAYYVVSSETFTNLIVGTATIGELMNGTILLWMFYFIMLLMSMKVRWIRRSSLVKFVREISEDERIGDLLERYKWIYVTPTELVFTDVRPSFFFRVSDRFPTNYSWEKPYRRDPISWFGDRVLVSGLYLRILWPYFFNPLQLAFLEYDKAAKHIGLKSGQKVLVIGAGSVPHHIRWKKRLGPNGMITALDVDPYVLKDSERIERTIECLRGIFGKRRWVSEHIPGDAAELPFEAATFDAVIAVRCYFVSVAEALRVLKPNGKLLISNCGDVAELPGPNDPRLKETFNGWIITNVPVREVVLQPTAV
jgi:SAM-dependent methyltransferase